MAKDRIMRVCLCVFSAKGAAFFEINTKKTKRKLAAQKSMKQRSKEKKKSYSKSMEVLRTQRNVHPKNEEIFMVRFASSYAYVLVVRSLTGKHMFLLLLQRRWDCESKRTIKVCMQAEQGTSECVIYLKSISHNDGLLSSKLIEIVQKTNYSF